jgi:hypothetical protein
MAVFLAVWPSGKAVDCKSSIPSSNLGAAFKYSSIALLFYKHIKYNIFTHLIRGRGGIGRHDGLKIRCLVIVREGSSPSVPI